MDNFIKSISAFILAIIVAINAFGNFIGIGDIIPTEPATTVEETTTIPEETTVTATEPSSAPSIVVMPSTEEEIIEYFNAAINNAKSASKSITSNYTTHAVAGEITGLPSALASIGQSLIKDNMGEDDSKKNITWSTAADKNAYFPVEGETWSSKLTTDDVKSAKVEETNGKWVITLTTVEDPRSEDYSHSNGHATKAFNAVLPSIVDGYIPDIAKTLFTIGAVATAYPSSTVTVTVDPVTGNVTHANYMLYWTLYIPMNGTDTALPFSTESDYDINW